MLCGFSSECLLSRLRRGSNPRWSTKPLKALRFQGFLLLSEKSQIPCLYRHFYERQGIWIYGKKEDYEHDIGRLAA